MSETEKLLITCGKFHSRNQYSISLLNLSNNELSYIHTTMETHDIVQSPLNRNLFIALGKRPPIATSYLINLNVKGVVDEVFALDNHSFYGHGFWTQENLVGTCEIDNLTFKSKIVLRNGQNLNEILEVFELKGFAIHQVCVDLSRSKIFAALNGNWNADKSTDKSSLEIIDLSTKKSEIFHFEMMPECFGFQHFLLEEDELYCLFRISPDRSHDTSIGISPLIKLNIQSKSYQSLSFPSLDTLNNFASDGLSLAANNSYIVATSQRGGKVAAWEKASGQFLNIFNVEHASGVSFLSEAIILVSSASGKLFKIDLYNGIIDKEFDRFFAGSHHHEFEVPK
jgi:hypothetical protein